MVSLLNKSSRSNRDTYWKNLNSLKKRTKNSYFLWGVRNPEATLFAVYDSYSQRVAADFLSDLNGVLLSDGHHSLKPLASAGLRLAHEWCHVRRKYKAAATPPLRSYLVRWRVCRTGEEAESSLPTLHLDGTLSLDRRKRKDFSLATRQSPRMGRARKCPIILGPRCWPKSSK
jgi:hypothetical protein